MKCQHNLVSSQSAPPKDTRREKQSAINFLQSAPPVQFPIIRERFKNVAMRVYHRHLSDAFSIAAGAPKYFFRRSASNFARRSYV